MKKVISVLMTVAMLAALMVPAFALDQNTPNERTSFDLTFYADTTKYHYHLELDTHSVYAEKLSFYRSTQPVMLFERRLEDARSIISFGNALKISSGVKEKITLECFKNMSFFGATMR